MTPTSRLIVRQGRSPQQEYELTEQSAVIGREPINDIQLQELEISRRHASIEFVNGRHTINDLNSTNGTFVNGRRISTPVVLNDGDVIDLGDTVSLVYQGMPRVVEQTLAQPDTGADAGATLGRELEDIQPSYAPPEDVPHYSGQQRPAPAVATTPAWQEDSGQAAYLDPEQIKPLPPSSGPDWRKIAAGCGCLLVLVVFGCIALYVFMDWYQEGDLLYCQALRPIWEAIFGEARVEAICQ